ncbi:MAG: hypothetical protein HY901_07965 [Deltaproteobacteria bacterium]|nr:hypothetical protein [Deltaproteobacteria bacterium]
MAHIHGCFDSIDIATIKQALNAFIDNTLRCALGNCGHHHPPEVLAGAEDDISILRHFITHLDDAAIEAAVDEAFDAGDTAQAPESPSEPAEQWIGNKRMTVPAVAPVETRGEAEKPTLSAQ